MKIKIDREVLLSKLQMAVKFVPGKAMLPAFLNFKMTIQNNMMEIIASDQNNQIKMYCPVISDTDGAMCLPAKLLLKTISLFNENEVLITKKTDKDIQIKSGNSKYKISIDCMPDDFPMLEVKNITSEININQFFLATAMKIAEKFVDENGKHANLVGIKVEEINNRIVFTGADSIGMSRVSIKPISNTHWDQIVLNTETATRVISLLEDQGEISIVHNKEKVRFTVGGDSKDVLEVCATTSNVKFPDTEMFFRKRPESGVVINTAEFKSAVKRLSLYSSGDDAVCYTMSSTGTGEMLLESSDENLGRSGQEVMTIVNEPQASFKKRFNSEVTLQILNNISENEFVFLPPAEHNKPCFIVPKIDEGREEMLSFLIIGMYINE